MQVSEDIQTHLDNPILFSSTLHEASHAVNHVLNKQEDNFQHLGTLEEGEDSGEEAGNII